MLTENRQAGESRECGFEAHQDSKGMRGQALVRKMRLAFRSPTGWEPCIV